MTIQISLEASDIILYLNFTTKYNFILSRKSNIFEHVLTLSNKE